MKRSVFTWDCEKGTRTFNHSAACLPGLPIASGSSTFQKYYTRFRQSMNDAISMVYSSHATTLPKNEFNKETSFDPRYVTDDEASDNKEKHMEARGDKKTVINDEPLNTKWEDDSNSYKLGQ
eukprot:10522037-Ditylum_brightwellii.AAC.1